MTLSLAQKRERQDDRGETMKLTKVERHGDYFDLLADYRGFHLRADYGAVPKVGDVITLYTHLGSRIHGIDLNGVPVFYKTKREQEEEQRQLAAEYREKRDQEFEDERARLDAAYDGLPDVFKRRIAWFRAHNDRFRQDFEAYELASCLDAVKLAAWAQEQVDAAEAIQRFQKLDYDKQKTTVPTLDYDRHSGNSFGFAIRLAFHYVTEPENVYHEHGAMVPLVGCVEYGCLHPREDGR